MAFRHKRDSIRAGEPIDDEEEAEAQRFFEQPGIERFSQGSEGVERNLALQNFSAMIDADF